MYPFKFAYMICGLTVLLSKNQNCLRLEVLADLEVSNREFSTNRKVVMIEGRIENIYKGDQMRAEGMAVTNGAKAIGDLKRD